VADRRHAVNPEGGGPSELVVYAGSPIRGQVAARLQQALKTRLNPLFRT
jgi:hypothetical protein